MEIVHRPIDQIKPYDRNAKMHPVDQVRKIAKSITEFGFNQPIVVDKQNVVVVGHGRLEAARLLGLTSVPVVEVDLPPAKARAYRLADNKLNESGWDMHLAMEELNELKLSGYDVSVIGFEEEMKINPEEPADDAPSEPGGKSVTCPECDYTWRP